LNGKYIYIYIGKVNIVPKYKRGVPEVLSDNRIKLQTKTIENDTQKQETTTATYSSHQKEGAEINS
jgi:hypothetical protein